MMAKVASSCLCFDLRLSDFRRISMRLLEDQAGKWTGDV